MVPGCIINSVIINIGDSAVVKVKMAESCAADIYATVVVVVNERVRALWLVVVVVVDSGTTAAVFA